MSTPNRPRPRRLTTAALLTSLLALGLGLGLGACSEKPQTSSGARKVDDKAWQGANTAFAAPGFKSTDDAGWQAQMRSRAQNQNEYSRAPAEARSAPASKPLAPQ